MIIKNSSRLDQFHTRINAAIILSKGKKKYFKEDGFETISLGY